MKGEVEMRNINHRIIEYPESNSWYLLIGNKAPWKNFHIRIPEIIAKLLLKKGEEKRK